MKKIGGSDIVDVLRKTIGDPSDTPPLMHHYRMEADTRGKYVFDLVRAWGAGMLFADRLPLCEEHGQKLPPIAPTDLAMRACEVVDATWNELEHRGWMIKTPRIDGDADG